MTRRATVVVGAAPMELGELMLAWQRGDGDAGTELTTAVFPKLCTFFRHCHPDAAEDLTQETLYRMLKASNFDPHQNSDCEQAFHAWMFTIARRLSRDRLERNRTAREKHGHLVAEHTPTSISDPEHLFIDDEESRYMVRLVGECLTELTAAHNEVLALEMAGLGSRQIAEVLGVKRGTAGSRLNRAHERFEQELARRGYRIVTPQAHIPEGAVVIGRFARGLLVAPPPEEDR